MQRDLKPATHGSAVDEGERRHLHLRQPLELRMSGLPDLECLLALGDQRHTGEICAHGEDERLTGQADCRQARLGGNLVQGGFHRLQRSQPEGVGPGVVVAVVHGDHGCPARARGKVEVANLELRDDLVVGLLAHALSPSV